MGYEEKKKELGLVYGIVDKPNWFSTLFFGAQVYLCNSSINLIYFQHFLASFAGILGTPLIIINYLCLDKNSIYGYVKQETYLNFIVTRVSNRLFYFEYE